MADANISLKTKNVFGLPSSFGLQNARRTISQVMPTAFGNTGACVASKSLEGNVDYSQDALYSGTALRTDLGVLATSFGQVRAEGAYSQNYPAITDADWWTGAVLTITGGYAGVAGEYTSAEMYNGKPIFRRGSDLVAFGGTKWSLQFNGNWIYQQDAANDWPWEGTWKVVAGQEAYAPTIDTPYHYLTKTGTTTWDNVSVTVEGAGTASFNDTYSFQAWNDGYPRFTKANGDHVRIAGLEWRIAHSGEYIYKATTNTTFPWEAAYELMAGTSDGVLPAPTVTTKGQAEYSVVPTDLNISYSASKNPSLTLAGHNHKSNAHASMGVTADISKIIPQTGFGVPSFGITLGSNCSPFSAELAAKIEHFDVQDADGTHLHGENTKKVSCLLSMTFSGVPTTTDEATLETELKAYFAGQGITISHLTVTGTDENNANSQFDGFALAAEFYAISD